jgi:hypothetical protein
MDEYNAYSSLVRRHGKRPLERPRTRKITLRSFLGKMRRWGGM